MRSIDQRLEALEGIIKGLIGIECKCPRCGYKHRMDDWTEFKRVSCKSCCKAFFTLKDVRVEPYCDAVVYAHNDEVWSINASPSAESVSIGAVGIYGNSLAEITFRITQAPNLYKCYIEKIGGRLNERRFHYRDFKGV